MFNSFFIYRAVCFHTVSKSFVVVLFGESWDRKIGESSGAVQLEIHA